MSRPLHAGSKRERENCLLNREQKKNAPQIYVLITNRGAQKDKPHVPIINVFFVLFWVLVLLGVFLPPVIKPKHYDNFSLLTLQSFII